jgi:uncharacterized protein involved in exopolysaccharide biosynthesis
MVLAPAARDLAPAWLDDRNGDRLLRLVLFTLSKRRWLILGITLAFTAASVTVASLQAPVQFATAKILIKGDRLALQVSGLAAVSRVAHSPQVLQSEVELIESRDVMGPVARERLAGRAAGARGPEAEEARIAKLQRNTVAMPIPDTNVIAVTHYAPTAERAREILGRILEHYAMLHANANSGAGKLLDFYGQEQARAAERLRRAEERLAGWRQANRLASVELEIGSQRPILADRERALQQTAAEIRATEARVAVLRAQLAVEPERLRVSQEQVTNPLLTALREELAGIDEAYEVDRHPLVAKVKGELVVAELASQELLQRYTPRDRRVREKLEQIEFLRTELATAEHAARDLARRRAERIHAQLAEAERREQIVGRETTALNPLREELKKDLASSEATLASLASRRAALEIDVRELGARLSGLSAKTLEEQRLVRAVTAAGEEQTLLAKKLEEAGIAAGMDREQLGTVAVIEQPHGGVDTRLGQRGFMVAFGSVVGLALGLGAAFGVEVVNHSFRTADDVEQYLGTPVLAAIPEWSRRPLTLDP